MLISQWSFLCQPVCNTAYMYVFLESNIFSPLMVHWCLRNRQENTSAQHTEAYWHTLCCQISCPVPFCDGCRNFSEPLFCNALGYFLTFSRWTVWEHVIQQFTSIIPKSVWVHFVNQRLNGNLIKCDNAITGSVSMQTLLLSDVCVYRLWCVCFA